MSRRVLRIEVPLPDLTPPQADLLWNLFDDLAHQIWQAYEIELLGFAPENSASKFGPQAVPEPPTVTPPSPQPLAVDDEHSL